MLENDWEFLIEAGQVTISRLILQQYKKLGLTEAELVLVLQITSQLQLGKAIPDIDEIAQAMGLENPQVYSLMHSLVEKKILAIKTVTDANGRETNQYSFNNLYQKLITLHKQEQQTNQQFDLAKERAEIFQSIEVEFGRALTPMELQSIDMWFTEDHYSPELIKLALREAVLNQVYNLKYIDRILISWDKQNVRTAKDVERILKKQQERRFDSKPNLQRNNQNKPAIPVYKWSNRTEGDN